MFPLNSVISCFSPLISRAHRSAIYLVRCLIKSYQRQPLALRGGSLPAVSSLIVGSRGIEVTRRTRAREGRRLDFCQRLYLAVLESYVEVARWILDGEPLTWKAFFLSFPSPANGPAYVARVSAMLFQRAPGARMPREGCRTQSDLLIMHVYVQTKLERKIRWIW